MSAYVVDDLTINRVLAHLAATDHRKARRLADAFSVDGSLPGLGQALRDLNVRAVRARYPDCTDDDISGPVGADGRLPPYQYSPEYAVGLHQATKSLRCLSYQCSEGDVPETPLFLALKDLSLDWLLKIAEGVPEYDRAQWG